MAGHTEDAIRPNEFTQPKFYHIRIVRVGLVQLIIGLFTLAVGVIDIAFSSVAFDIFPTAKAGTGIWVGVVIVLTGIVGVVQSRSNLRRKAASIAFLVLSSLSWMLAIVMIGIAIAEIAQSEFAEGELRMQEKLSNNGTDCSNITENPQSDTRCVATITFDQKLVTDSLLVAFGYIESIAAFYSVISSFAIARNQWKSEKSNGIGLRERVDIPEISVNAYFEERIRQEERDQGDTFNSMGMNSASQRRQIHSTQISQTLHPSPSTGDFPDSEQFRSHLEVVTGSFPERHVT